MGLTFLSCDISRLDCYPLNTLCIFWGWLWSQVTQRPHIWYWPDFGDQTDSIVVITCKIKCYETSNLKTFHRTQFIYSSIQASTGCWGVKKEHFGADFAAASPHLILTRLWIQTDDNIVVITGKIIEIKFIYQKKLASVLLGKSIQIAKPDL